MEKEHKSKNKVQKVKKEVVVEPKKSEVIEEVRITTAPDNTALGTFPRVKPKDKDKKKKNRSVLSFYIFMILLLCGAFVFGGVSAKVIPNISFDFLNKSHKQNTDDTSTQAVNESTVSSTPTETAPPQESNTVLKTQPPAIAAKAYGIFVLKDGEYQELSSKNPDASLPLASVTKVMTAIVALENYDLDKPVVVPAKCVGLSASSVGFKPNDVFSMQDILYGMLVKSGADAACAIANIDNEPDFIAKMNSRATELGMTSTKFTNPIGLDNSNEHISDVNDLKLLVTHALKFSTFRKIVGTEEITITSKSNGANYHVRNTNDLLFSIPGTVGIKTGYTDSAGECLAYLYQNKDQEILIIILGSLDRFGDTSKLLEWAKTEISPTPVSI